MANDIKNPNPRPERRETTGDRHDRQMPKDTPAHEGERRPDRDRVGDRPNVRKQEMPGR